MKTRRIIYIIMAIIPLAMACEKIIDIDIPETERKIVLNGLINPDSLVEVNISRSMSVLDDNKFVFLENAIVSLYENDSKKGDLKYMGSGNYKLPDFYPSSGFSYRLEVESSGLKSVSALTELLPPVPISEIDTSSIEDSWGNNSLKLSFSLQDPPEENYYAISLNVTHRVFDYEKFELTDSMTTYRLYFEFLTTGQGGVQDLLVEDNAIVYFNEKVFMADHLFNGKEFNMDLSVGKYFFMEVDTVWIDVNVDHVSKPYYLYAASIIKYNRTYGNPFSEPVSVYTNVENGLGIFTGYSTVSRKIEVITGGGR